MNIKEFLGLNSFDTDTNGRQWTHQEKYMAIVNALGYEAVKKCIPFTLDEIKKALPKDEHLNNLSMKKWDRASGFINKVNRKTGTEDVIHVGSPLNELYREVGINCYSESDGVCVLKQCARMWYNENKNV